MYRWKNKKKFAFTIVDDTDGATVENIKPVYDCLYNNGIITTKTVWLRPSRDYFPGDSLENPDYRTYIKDLCKKGFEIAYHEAGSGEFKRKENLDALSEFNEIFGYYPKVHINHGDNPGGIYWCGERFSPPVRLFYNAFKRLKHSYVKSGGSDKNSDYFWGDECKKHVKYIRNRVFTELNLLKRDKNTPYRERKKESCSNYWFSSSDAIDADAFVRLLSEKNIDRLEKEGGCAIIYVHFGYGFVENGELRADVKKAIEYVSAKDGWFAPVSEILDFMLDNKKKNKYLSPIRAFCMDLVWGFERIKRKF